jgi:hypothetical protein
MAILGSRGWVRPHQLGQSSLGVSVGLRASPKREVLASAEDRRFDSIRASRGLFGAVICTTAGNDLRACQRATKQKRRARVCLSDALSALAALNPICSMQRHRADVTVELSVVNFFPLIDRAPPIPALRCRRGRPWRAGTQSQPGRRSTLVRSPGKAFANSLRAIVASKAASRPQAVLHRAIPVPAAWLSDHRGGEIDGESKHGRIEKERDDRMQRREAA